MAVEYRAEAPHEDEYFELFRSTGWNEELHLTERELGEAVRRSWHILAAYDGGKLVGSGRIVSDGVLHALIVDVIVLPECQGRGIGSALMERLVEACRAAGIRDVQLFSARGKAGFYERLGFRARDPEAPGMDLPAPCANSKSIGD